MRPVSGLDVAMAFKQLGTAKAPGADGVPAEFVTKACTEAEGALLLEVVARMCNTVLQLGCIGLHARVLEGQGGVTSV